MNRTILLLLTLVVITATSLATYYINTKKSSQYRAGISGEADRAVQMAKEQYQIKKKAGVDFRLGPCLDNNLMTNWVADIVHNPRVRSDNQPENECSNYLIGKAQHFVELDVEGNVVRVQ